MKIKMSGLLAILAAAPHNYAGDKTPAAVKSFCVEKKIKFAGPNGDVDPANLEVIEDAPVAAKAIDLAGLIADEPKPAPAAAVPEDMAVKMQAMVADAMKAAGLQPTGRPSIIDSTKAVTSVKTSDQRQFEDDAAAGRTTFRSYDTAYGFSNYLRAQAAKSMGRGDIAHKCGAAYGEWVARKGYTTGAAATGAAYLRDDFDPDVIRLVKVFGVARKVCKVWKMNSDKVSRPRVSNAGYTVYYPGEGVAGTESTESSGTVQLTAKEGIVIAKASRSFLDDNAVNAADDIAREIARSIAKVEDDSLFNGPGGTTSGYIPGVQGIITLFGSTATDDSRSVIGGADWFAHTKGDLLELMSKVPQFVGGMPAWHCSYEAGAMLLNAAQSQGGATVAEFQGFGLLPTLFNRPVIYNNSMNRTSGSASGTIDLLYGDISQAAYFGDRTAVEIDVSEQRYWDESNIGFKGRVRHDITVHDLGSTTDQSPVAALYQS